MRFMAMVKATKDSEAGKPSSPELMEAIGKLTMEMMSAGKILGVGGLLPSSAGARVHLDNGTITVIDGPFAETKELIGGYAILNAKSREEAIELTRIFLKAHSDVDPGYVAECEIRQMFDEGQCGSQQEQAA